MLVLSCALSGCGSCKTGGQTPIEYRGGESSSTTLSYETSGVSGEYLHFPAGRRFDLIHELGLPPFQVQSYVSFQRLPAEPDQHDNTGNYAEAAGNQVVIECQDSERIRVRNDTCAELYLRVVAQANPDLSVDERRCSGATTERD